MEFPINLIQDTSIFGAFWNISKEGKLKTINGERKRLRGHAQNRGKRSWASFPSRGGSFASLTANSGQLRKKLAYDFFGMGHSKNLITHSDSAFHNNSKFSQTSSIKHFLKQSMPNINNEERLIYFMIIS